MTNTPSLEEVISGNSTTPYTLSQFASFLESFHCIENLEYVLGVKRIIEYQNYHINNQADRDTDLLSQQQEHIHHYSFSDIMKLWESIYHDFLLESSLKEVNLPCNVKSELLKYNPHEIHEIPARDLILQSVKIVYELLEDSYTEFTKNIHSGNNRRISESTLPPTLDLKYIELPKSPESFIQEESRNGATSPIFFKPASRPSFSHFQLDRPLLAIPDEDANIVDQDIMHAQNAVACYTSPSSSSSPSPKPLAVNRRASEPNEAGGFGLVRSPEGKANGTSVSSTATTPSSASQHTSGASRQNSTSSSSRGSSIGSIVETFMDGDHISWRKAVKKFKIRRFSSENLHEEEREQPRR